MQDHGPEILEIAVDAARTLGQDATAYDLLGAVLHRCGFAGPEVEKEFLKILPALLDDLGISRLPTSK